MKYRRSIISQYHQHLSEISSEKIKEAIAQLKANQQLSEGITTRSIQIIRAAKVSRKTLYKRQNLGLWHPNFLN